MSSIRPTSNVVSAFAAAVVIIAMSCLPAHAGVQTDKEMTGDDILAALQSATPQTMFAAAAVDIEEGDPDEVTYRSGSVTAQIDADPAEGVTLTRGSLRISMSVPDASDVSSLPTSNGDLVVYGGEGDASVVPVIVRDGSIQLNAIWPYLLVAAGCIAVTLAIYVHAAAMGVQADESALPAPSETALLSLGEIAVALLSTTIAIVSIVLAIRDAGKRGR